VDFCDSHGRLAPRRVGELPPVEQVPVLGDRERAAGSGGNPVHRQVRHAGENVHHARPQLVVLAGVPEPPVPLLVQFVDKSGDQCEHRNGWGGGLGSEVSRGRGNSKSITKREEEGVRYLT